MSRPSAAYVWEVSRYLQNVDYFPGRPLYAPEIAARLGLPLSGVQRTLGYMRRCGNASFTKRDGWTYA